jgi:hypothetical protein
MQDFQLIKDILPFLIAVSVVEIVLLFIAIIDLDRRKYVTGNNKLVWVLVIVLFGVIGPIIYFVFGRKGKPVDKQ